MSDELDAACATECCTGKPYRRGLCNRHYNLSIGAAILFSCIDCGAAVIHRVKTPSRGDRCPRCAVTLKNTTHGEYRTRLNNIWHSMRSRCLKESSNAYSYYGGRGISVCDDWQSYERFRDWALGNGYRSDLTIDRINNDGNYEPGNCRWATKKEQSVNRRPFKRRSCKA